MAKVYNFRTPVSERKVVHSKTGERFEKELALMTDDKGIEKFYVKSKTDTYEKIQAFAEDCKIENILLRCRDLGDYSMLNQAEPMYADISDMPKSYIEAHNKIQKMEQNFNDLPLEIRNKFDNSFTKYLAEAGSENWMKNMGLWKEPEKAEEPAPVTKEDNAE